MTKRLSLELRCFRLSSIIPQSYAIFKLTEGRHSIARLQRAHFWWSTRVVTRWTLPADILQPLQHSCLKSSTPRNSFVVIAGRQFYNYVRFSRQQEVVISAPRGQTVVLSGAPSNQSSIIGRGREYEFAELHETYRHCHVRAVKQTDRHHHRRRCREIRCHRRFCSPLRRWYLRCLLAGIPFSLRTVRCGRPIRYSLDYCSRYSIALFVPSCICHS